MLVGRNFFNETHSSDMLQLPLSREAIPAKEAAFHFCYSSATMRPIISFLHSLASTEMRPRFKPHYGKRGGKCKPRKQLRFTLVLSSILRLGETNPYSPLIILQEVTKKLNIRS